MRTPERATLKCRPVSKEPAHSATLPRHCAQISIHQSIDIDSCNADTDHVASQPGIDQGMENQYLVWELWGRRNFPDWAGQPRGLLEWIMSHLFGVLCSLLLTLFNFGFVHTLIWKRIQPLSQDTSTLQDVWVLNYQSWVILELTWLQIFLEKPFRSMRGLQLKIVMDYRRIWSDLKIGEENQLSPRWVI